MVSNAPNPSDSCSYISTCDSFSVQTECWLTSSHTDLGSLRVSAAATLPRAELGEDRSLVTTVLELHRNLFKSVRPLTNNR